jgi:hypothetical protein
MTGQVCYLTVFHILQKEHIYNELGMSHVGNFQIIYQYIKGWAVFGEVSDSYIE